jgi:alpha/beta superfamily hydrolase
MSAQATAVDERPVFIPSGQEHLFGVVTDPPNGAVGVGVIVLPGAGPGGSTHRTGMSVRVCRDLATSGFHAIRFDWHGIGDSTGPSDRFRLDRPFVDDLRAAYAWLKDEHGLERFGIVASCFGARTALAAAPSMDGVEALLLFAPPIRDARFADAALAGLAETMSVRRALRVAAHPRMMLRLLDARRRAAVRRFAAQAIRDRLPGRGPSDDADDFAWVSPHLLRHVEAVVDAGIATTFVYGLGDDYYRDFRRAVKGELGRIVERGRIELETISPYAIHSWDRIEGQEAAQRLVREWAERYPRRRPVPASRA